MGNIPQDSLLKVPNTLCMAYRPQAMLGKEGGVRGVYGGREGVTLTHTPSRAKPRAPAPPTLRACENTLG